MAEKRSSKPRKTQKNLEPDNADSIRSETESTPSSEELQSERSMDSSDNDSPDQPAFSNDSDEKSDELESVKPDGDRPSRHKKPETDRKESSGDEFSENEKNASISNFFGRLTEATTSAFNFARKTTGTSYKVGKAIIQSQDQLKLMLAAGQTLKDLREVAGLTVMELSDAVNLKDKSIIEAVENGTATLSFELILRLAALLARNDPIPFVLKLSRAYAPETWKFLDEWGAGRIPTHYQREREFINIFRSQDEARKLSDAGFERVLEFTKGAFDMSLHFVAEQENMVKTAREKMQNDLDENLDFEHRPMANDSPDQKD